MAIAGTSLFDEGMLGQKFAAAFLLLCSFASLAAEEELLPSYKPTMEAKGMLTSVGSDTLNNLMVFWGEEFKKAHPGLNFQIEGKGGATAMGALIGGISDMGPTARPPNPREVEVFKKQFPEHDLVMFTVALDALSIVVHKDNPLEALSLTQVDAIYSTTFNRGAKEPITKWSQLSVEGLLADKKIQLLGRNSASGTYGYFKHSVLLGGDFRDDVQEQPGSVAVVTALTPNHLGYVGFGYVSPMVKALKVRGDGEYVAPSFDTIRDGSYPISRSLYIVVPAHKQMGIKPEVREFLRLIFSKEGHDVVKRDGYVPLGLQECRHGHRLIDAKTTNLND